MSTRLAGIAGGAEERQGDHRPERMTHEVGSLEAERGNERSKSVGELRGPPAVIDVRRVTESRSVPRDDGVVERKVGEHPLPRAAVGWRTVQHHQRRSYTGTGVGDPHPVDLDVGHSGILPQNPRTRRGMTSHSARHAPWCWTNAMASVSVI